MGLGNKEGFIWMNGQWLDWADAKVHFLTHSLHYSSSVFEGERSYGGRVFKARPHHERLLRSAEIVDYTVPYTADQIDWVVQDVLKRNNLNDAYIRPLAWRGDAEMGIGNSNGDIQLAIAAWEWPNYYADDVLTNGLKLSTSRWRRPSPECAPVHAKASGLYQIGTISKNEAIRKGFDEALILDWQSRVAEASVANMFMVLDGELHTPIADCFLNGLTRQTVIQLAKANGIKVHERRIWPYELAGMDEIFICGTVAEVTPIGRIDENIFEVGPVTKRMRQLYMDLVHSETIALGPVED